MISIRDLQISVESRILLSVDFLDVHPGERVAIYGHGGSGKSLLLDYLSGDCSAEMNCQAELNLNTFRNVSYYDFNKNWTSSVINLLSRPVDLCLIDEPENCLSLDRFRVFCDYMKASNSTMVFVTHHLSYVEKCCDRVIILKSGESRGSYMKHDFFNNDDPYVNYVSTMGC